MNNPDHPVYDPTDQINKGETMSVTIPKTVRNVGELNHRHGDIGLVAIEPQGAKRATKLPHLTLARGASTGHSHRLVSATSAFTRGYRDQLFVREEKPAKATLYQDGETMLLNVRAKAALVHDEHGAIFLAPGWYEVIGQREYSPEGDQRVWD